MTTNRSTNEQIQERVNFAADELAKGRELWTLVRNLHLNIV